MRNEPVSAIRGGQDGLKRFQLSGLCFYVYIKLEDEYDIITHMFETCWTFWNIVASLHSR